LTKINFFVIIFPNYAMKDMIDKLKIFEEYQQERNLSKVARKYNIHPSTLCRWLKRLEDQPEDFFIKRWNRPEQKIEEKIMMLKENKPDLTLNKAKKIFEDMGFDISIKGIYSIWRRYGLVRRPVDEPFSHFGPLTSETKRVLEYAQYWLKRDNSTPRLKTIAKVINRLPSYPIGYDEILEKIPERFLSLRRRLDKLYTQFLRIPTPIFYRKIHRLRLTMEKNGLYYSSIIAGLLEILALQWMHTPEKEIGLNALLRKRMGNLRDPALNYQLTFLEVTARTELLQMKEAQILANKLSRLLKNLPYSTFYESFGDMMTFLGDYNKSLEYYKIALEIVKDPDGGNRLKFKIGLDLTISGKHQEALKYLKNTTMDYQDKYYESYALTSALANFGLGRIEQALEWLKKTLERSKKDQFRNRIYTTICCFSAIAKAMGNESESQKLLRQYLPLIKKYKLKRETEIMENLLNPEILKPVSKHPSVQLIYFLKIARKSLKIGDYEKVLRFAKRYGLVGYLQRCLIFIPEPVTHLLNRGKNPELPKAFLRLPLFNPETPVYQLKILGKPVIHKNQKYLKFRLRPQEIAFFIHLGLRASEPGRSLPVDDIYTNFFPKVIDAQSRLAHLLANLKNQLMLPRHLLVIQSSSGFKVLLNKGFYISTDYSEFEQTLARAKALQSAGEWEFAKKEYLQAFKLFRGEPFKKNFDDWSVNMRFKILSELETEAIEFAKACLEHNNKRDARKILEKVLKIIPDSEETKKMMQDPRYRIFP